MWINDEEEQGNKTQNNTNTNVGAGGGSSAPTFGSNTPQGNPSTISPTNTGGKTQNFATIQDYLGANKQQGENLGEKVTSSLSDTQNQEKGAIDTAANNVTNALGTSSTYNPDIVKTSLENPTNTINDPNKLTTFLKQWNGAYSGPENFESTTDYNTAAKAASDATQKAGQVSTTGGREQLLQDQFGVYGQGNKGLDQALLESSSSFPKVQDLGTKFKSVQDYLTSKSNGINAGAIPLAKQKVATNSAQAQSDFNTGVKNFENTVNTEATNTIAPKNLSVWNQVAQAYNNKPGFLTPTQNPGVDLARYLTATPEERQRYASFMQLAGKSNSFLPTASKTKDMSELSGILNSLKNRG